jgi:transglutaminase-like putative cysteine protease
MNITIDHETHYRYDAPTRHSIQLLRLTPLSQGHQRVLSWTLVLPRFGSELFDGFGNYCTVMSLHEPHESLMIQARGEVEIDEDRECVDGGGVPPQVFLRDTPLTRCNGQMRALAERHLRHGGTREALREFSADILRRMPYTRGATAVATTAAEAFLLGKGVCQDHTHVFLACARAFGIPARYVSGYLLTDAEGHLASHAWAEACLDGRWYVYDVSNQLFSPSRHVRVAIGLDYNDAAPVRGVRVGGGRERMDYTVRLNVDQ